jgi:CspA family cold shock protein
MDGFRTLKQGGSVSYELVQGPKGDLAHNIRSASSADSAAAAEAARGLYSTA